MLDVKHRCMNVGQQLVEGGSLRESKSGTDSIFTQIGEVGNRMGFKGFELPADNWCEIIDFIQII